MIGKFILIVGVLAILAYGGYFFGKKQVRQQTQVTPTGVSKKTITAGLDTSSGLSYTKYSIEVPQDWTVTTDNHQSVPIDTLFITKGDYQIKIFQAPTGDSICLYPGDNTFMSLTTVDGLALRRSGTITPGSDAHRSFTICHFSEHYNFQQPTVFGHTSYKTPLTPDEVILRKMDAMISSLKKL